MRLVSSTSRRVRVFLLAIAVCIASVVSIAMASPASANTLYCGSGQNSVLHSNYAGYYYVSVGCYPGWILMADGDSVDYPASAGAVMRIDARVQCAMHEGTYYYHETNWNYSGSIYVTQDVNTRVNVDSCYVV